MEKCVCIFLRLHIVLGGEGVVWNKSEHPEILLQPPYPKYMHCIAQPEQTRGA